MPGDRVVMPNDEAPQFSRSGESLPDGKCTNPVKTELPDPVFEDFVALAVMKGKRPAEFLRVIIYERLYGEFETARSKVSGEPVRR